MKNSIKNTQDFVNNKTTKVSFTKIREKLTKTNMKNRNVDK